MMNNKLPISAFAINYNGSDYLKGCLQSLSFCDQLIYIDKSSTDDSVEVARQFTDERYIVDWSPIVEHTRPFALSKCKHDWVLFLDHDEMVDPNLIKWLSKFINNDDYDGAAILRKNYYFGQWSPLQRSWPSSHIRLFRRELGYFEPEIHTTVKLKTDRIYRHQESDGGSIIHHGYETLSQWTNKANRYTSTTSWADKPFQSGEELFEKIDQLLDNAKSGFANKGGDDYEAVSHTLFFLYKIQDELKNWESQRGDNIREQYLQDRENLINDLKDFLQP